MKCTGDHAHVPLVGGRAAGAQVYPQMLCDAICRGVARQQREDASMGVSGRMSADEVRSFVHYTCNLNEDDKSSIQKIQSITDTEDGAAPAGAYPEHWVDNWHELEGGNGLNGSRPQCGVTLLQADMNGLSFKSGSETAWNDVSNENLVVHAARALEVEYFHKLGVYEKVLP